MSKIRENLVTTNADLKTPAVSDGQAFVVFTKKRADLPCKFAGYVNAPDAALGLTYAREHYGQDEECVSIWLAPTEAIAANGPSHSPGSSPGADRPFEVFVRQNEGGVHVHHGSVNAHCAKSALEEAMKSVPRASESHSIWVIDAQEITATDPDDLIWRHVSQDYRMARGYSRDVREKWERIRAVEEVDRYQSEDLKETF